MEEPLRFRCPPEFEPAPPPGPSLAGAAPEVWLIRAPPDFNPESLEGRAVPLARSGQFPPPPHGGAHCQYGARVAPAGGGAERLLLLTPPTQGGALRCAPPLRGVLAITRSFGSPPRDPPSPPPPGRGGGGRRRWRSPPRRAAGARTRRRQWGDPCCPIAP